MISSKEPPTDSSDEEGRDGEVHLRTTTWQECEAVPLRARIQGSYIVVPLNSRLESNKEEAKWGLQ